jgi:hypothetical protein
MPAFEWRADRANGNGFEAYPWGRTGVDDAFDAGRPFARGGVCFPGAMSSRVNLSTNQARALSIAANT